MPKYLVVDANIWISNFEFGGQAKLALQKAQSEYLIAASSQLLEEVLSVFEVKFQYSRRKISRVRTDMKGTMVFFEPTEILSVCRDPKDDYLLALAVEAQASILLTGDKDLLVLNPYCGVSILTPQQFLG